MSPVLAEMDWNTLLGDRDLLVVVAVWFVVGVVVLGSIIAIEWRKVQQTRREADLTEQMIERGFTADEIVNVLNAGTRQARLRKPAEKTAPAGDHACCSKPVASG